MIQYVIHLATLLCTVCLNIFVKNYAGDDDDEDEEMADGEDDDEDDAELDEWVECKLDQ
jgi:hypothetical protein